jgi:hypothetical protein
MGGFLRGLAKLGLVELDDHEEIKTAAEKPPASVDDIDRLLAETRAMTDAIEGAGDDGDPPDVTPTPPTHASSAQTPLEPSRPLAELYSRAGIPPSPFPAEKLLRMLEGLAAMEPHIRTAAIMAMDQADDAWTVQDAVLDADRKMKALAQAKTEVAATAAEAARKASADLEAQTNYAAQAAETIRE